MASSGKKYRTKGNNDDVAGEGKGARTSAWIARCVVHLWRAMKLRFGVA